MEWLINRRRMMFNKAVPPSYLAFEDAEVWKLCCINWGDYNETVITDNGNNTVNITTTFKSKLNSTIKKSIVISSQKNVDNAGGTYVAGTTTEPVGITQKQCVAVSSLRTVFKNNSLINVFLELVYFTGLTSIVADAFTSSAISSVRLPVTITSLGNVCFRYTKISAITVPEGCTSLGNHVFGGNVIQFVDLPSTFSSCSGNLLWQCTGMETLICRAATPPTIASSDSFYNLPSTCKVYVPQASLNSYKSASVWTKLTNQYLPIEGSEYEH